MDDPYAVVVLPREFILSVSSARERLQRLHRHPCRFEPHVVGDLERLFGTFGAGLCLFPFGQQQVRLIALRGRAGKQGVYLPLQFFDPRAQGGEFGFVAGEWNPVAIVIRLKAWRLAVEWSLN